MPCMQGPSPFSLTLQHPLAVQAVRDMLPGSVAMAAWGLVTGVAMVQSGLSTWQALGMTLMVFAGSAQLASLPLFAVGAPLLIIWVSALVVNLRFVIYSVAVKPFFRGFPLWKRMVYGFGNVDILAAEFLRRFDAGRLQEPALLKSEDPQSADGPQGPIVYFRTAAVMNWMVWQSSSVLGIILAQWIPAAWGLEFVATLALIAMLMPMIIDRASLVCVAVAGAVAAAGSSLPLNLGLLLAVIAGVAVAMMFDSLRPQHTQVSLAEEPVGDAQKQSSRGIYGS